MKDSAFSLDRRALGAGLAAIAIEAGAPGVALARVPVITVLGDSITAGYGLPRAAALPVQLQAALARDGVHARVIGAGVSGDATADGLRRVDRAVRRGVDLCLVALGANDLLQEVPAARVKANLLAIVRRLRGRGIPAAIAGMRAPPILDAAYVRAFDSVFADVGRETGAPVYPFLLEGVAFDPRLNQPDRIHPNAAGVRVIAARLAPFVAGAVRRA